MTSERAPSYSGSKSYPPDCDSSTGFQHHRVIPSQKARPTSSSSALGALLPMSAKQRKGWTYRQ